MHVSFTGPSSSCRRSTIYAGKIPETNRIRTLNVRNATQNDGPGYTVYFSVLAHVSYSYHLLLLLLSMRNNVMADKRVPRLRDSEIVSDGIKTGSDVSSALDQCEDISVNMVQFHGTKIKRP